MEDRPLSTEEKREYLRLFFTEGSLAAWKYYRRLTHWSKMVFESHEEADEYFRQREIETGETTRYWAIIKPAKEETKGEGEGLINR